MANLKKRLTLPLIPVRGIVIYPFMILHFDVARPKSIAALEAAMASHQHVFLTSQKDISVEEPAVNDFYETGTVAKVKQLLKLPGNGVRVLVEGLYRARVTSIISEEPYYNCESLELRSKSPAKDSIEEKAAIRMLHDLFDEYSSLNPRMSAEVFRSISGLEDSGRFADSIAANFIKDAGDKQSILAELNVLSRLTKLVAIMTRELELLRTERDIMAKVKGQIDQNQREYFLREQMSAIKKELGADDANEIEEYRGKIAAASLPDEVNKKAKKELERLEKMSPQMPEGAVIRNYLDWLLELPFNITTPENLNIKRAEKVLNSDHYGLKKVKTRILEYLAVRKLSGGTGAQILCLVGPPGVGKTSIARSIADAMGRNYTRISLGGVRDEAEIRGHRRTYIGSMPGRIINAIKLAGSSNSLILLDEIDKLGNDFRGDPASALLEVLDPEQNFSFRDHYLEVPFDLSKTMFITTANNTDTIPRPLLDRMEIIQISGYTSEEKINIAVRHLLPKALEKNGMNSDMLKIRRPAVADIIEYYTREAGVRNLEREISRVCRRAAKLIVSGEETVSVTSKNLEDFLGQKKYRHEKLLIKEEVGIVRGLAWTSVGGDTISIEVNVMDGSGKIELTGQLGNVMKESARAAISYIRTRTAQLGIAADFYKTKDIHLHIPEGAVPKDGPSAGITIATAIISALSQRPVRGDIAMTGEITLRGRVLPVGGILEKVLAAYRFGIKTVILPAENEKDLNELPDKVRDNLEFVLAANMETVTGCALPPPKMPLSMPPLTLDIQLPKGHQHPGVSIKQ